MSDNKTREELNTYDFDTLVNLVVGLVADEDMMKYLRMHRRQKIGALQR